MLTIEQLKQEAKDYQKVTDTCVEFKDLVLEVFYKVIDFEDHQTFWNYREAIVDVMLSIVNENYKGIIYSLEFKDNFDNLDITLNFVYDNSVREFKLTEYDFKSYAESQEEED